MKFRLSRLTGQVLVCAAFVTASTVMVGGVSSGSAAPLDLPITQEVAVPSYIHPLADPAAWAALATAPAGTLGFAVANVINGPDYVPLPEWTDVIQRVAASGVGVVGYVDTGYLGTTGQRTRLGSTDPLDWMSQIQHDVAAWYQFYGTSLSGIFFDQTQNACGPTPDSNAWADLYTQLSDDVERLHPGAQTVLNPGIGVPQCYEFAGDVIVTFEGSYGSYVGDPTAANPYTPLTWTPTDPMKIWHIVYGAADTVAMTQAVALSKTRGAGYIYVTDDVLANPYDTLPTTYWAAELATTPGVPGLTKPPARPLGLDTSEVFGTSVDLDWAEAPKRSSVAAYDVYRDGVLIDSVPGNSPKYSAVDLAPLTTYVFTVVARDVWGRTSPPSHPLAVMTDQTSGDPRKPVVGITTELVTYTSAVLAWQLPADRARSNRPGIAETLIFQNGREVLRLPGGATSVTVGGLAPASTYSFSVQTVDATGQASAATVPLDVTTLALPGPAMIGQTSITESPEQFVYSADYLVPVAFRRVFISTGNPANPCWSTGSEPQICADYLIENERLLRYTGDGAKFDWVAVRDVPPAVVGYTYTWAISPADIGSPATAVAVFNGNGYAPNTYCGAGFACVSTGVPLPYE